MLKYLIKKYGCKLIPKKMIRIFSKLAGGQFVPGVYLRLKHLKKLGFSPKVIIDGGAYLGEWSLRTSNIFPSAQFIIIEPNADIISKTKINIDKISSKNAFLNVAIGAQREKGFLNVWDNKETSMEGSSLLDHVQGEAIKHLPVDIRTLNDICDELRLTPDIIKLDLQGGELSALKGASSLFGKTELFIIEFGCLDAYVNRTSPRQLFDLMYDNGYCLYDVVDIFYRPYDGALCSGDFFFLKNESKLKSHKGFL